MATKTHFTDSWCRFTGEPEKEARYRARVLSEDGLLPRRQERFTTTHLAHWLLAVTTAPSHKDASETVRRFCEMRPICMLNAAGYDFMNLSLFETVKKALESPYSIILMRGSITASSFFIQICKSPKIHFLDNYISGMSYGDHTEITFKDAEQLIVDTATPVQTWREINFSLVYRLNLVVKDLDENDNAGSVGAEPAHVMDDPTALAGQQGGAPQHSDATDSGGASQPPPEPQGVRPMPKSRIRQQEPPWPKSSSRSLRIA